MFKEVQPQEGERFWDLSRKTDAELETLKAEVLPLLYHGFKFPDGKFYKFVSDKRASEK